LTIQLPTNSGIYGVVEVTCWSPRPKYEQSPGSEGAYLLKNFKLSYEMPEGSIFGDFPVTDTNRFAMDLNTFGEEKTISPILSSYINWRFGYAVLFKPDYSAPVEKVDIGQSQSHEGEDEVYLEKRLLWAMQYYYSTAQREITFPIRTSTIYSPLTFFVDTSSKSHYLLSQSTNWRDDEQTIKIFDNLQSSAPSTYRVTVSGNVNEAGISSVTEGGSLSLTLATADNYSLNSATVSMGGTDITSSAYSNGVVTIANVTGNVVITAATTKLYDAQVEYIESDGTAYIDSGINLRQKLSFRINMSISKSISAVSLIMGAYFDNSSYPKIQALILATQKWGSVSSSLRTQYSITGVTSGGSVVVGTKYTPVITNLKTQNSDATVYLFARNNDGGSYLPIDGMRIYWCDVLDESSNKLRDFIPVRYNGVGYLFDKVTKTRYGNASGSGSFTYGSDV